MRTRLYGGVGGSAAKAAPYPDPGLVLTLTSQQQGTSPQPLHKCCQLWTW